MKGAIISCLKELVVSKAGKEKWNEIMLASNQNPMTPIYSNSDVPDAEAMNIVKQTCNILNISLIEAADAFGDYWVNNFAARIYQAYYMGRKSAKDFILQMNDVHERVTKNIENSSPPKFSYQWETDKILYFTYHSNRGLIDFVVGLLKGVGRYYKENLKVTKLSDTIVEIVFE